MAETDGYGRGGQTATPDQLSSLTDRDGDTIMQDFRPTLLIHGAPSTSPISPNTRSRIQTDRQSFSGGSIEQLVHGTLQASTPGLQTRPSPQVQTKTIKRDTNENRQRSWLLFPPIESAERIVGGSTPVIAESQRYQISSSLPLPAKNIEVSRRLIPIHESLAMMTNLAKPEAKQAEQSYKRQRTSIGDTGNRVALNDTNTNRALPSPIAPRIGHDRIFATSPRSPSLELRPLPPMTRADAVPNTRTQSMFSVPAFNFSHPQQPQSTIQLHQHSSTSMGERLREPLNLFDTAWAAESTPAEPEWMNTPGPVFANNHRLIATSVSRKRKQLDTKQMACTGCMDDFDIPVLIRLPCQCRYCPECLNRLVAAGCSTAADFPPKCHGQALRISTYGPALDKETSDRYKQIEAEFSTQTPQYCAVPTCSAFIAQSQIIETDDIGICAACGECTCTKCNTVLSMHKYQELQRTCPSEGSDMVALRALGQKDGWMQCPACQTMIDKVDGCNHIACSCGVEFCYSCGSFYDEENLCECTSSVFEDETEGDDDDVDSIDESHVDDDEVDEDLWPDHRRIFDSMGRQKCWHLTTHTADGALCHGCLDSSSESLLYQCRECHAELCKNCLNQVYDDHVKALDREHEDSVWKILSLEKSHSESPFVDVVAAQNARTVSMQAHEANMISKWAPHQQRRQETWAEHKTKIGLS